MAFYIETNKERERVSNVVSKLSEKIYKINGVWEIRAADIVKALEKPEDSRLILIQREGKPNQVEFEVVKFIGYTHQEGNDWWSPLVIQGLDEEGQLVHCFVYIVSEASHTFADSHIYGPNIWPQALIAICERALADVKHELFGRTV